MLPNELCVYGLLTVKKVGFMNLARDFISLIKDRTLGLLTCLNWSQQVGSTPIRVDGIIAMSCKPIINA